MTSILSSGSSRIRATGSMAVTFTLIFHLRRGKPRLAPPGCPSALLAAGHPAPPVDGRFAVERRAPSAHPRSRSRPQRNASSARWSGADPRWGRALPCGTAECCQTSSNDVVPRDLVGTRVNDQYAKATAARHARSELLEQVTTGQLTVHDVLDRADRRDRQENQSLAAGQSPTRLRNHQGRSPSRPRRHPRQPPHRRPRNTPTTSPPRRTHLTCLRVWWPCPWPDPGW